MDTLNLTSLNQTSEEKADIRKNFILILNYLINSIDKMSIPFPPGNHELWNAVKFLERIFEQYLKVLFYVTKLSGKPM